MRGNQRDVRIWSMTRVSYFCSVLHSLEVNVGGPSPPRTVARDDFLSSSVMFRFQMTLEAWRVLWSIDGGNWPLPPRIFSKKAVIFWEVRAMFWAISKITASFCGGVSFGPDESGFRFMPPIADNKFAVAASRLLSLSLTPESRI